MRVVVVPTAIHFEDEPLVDPNHVHLDPLTVSFYELIAAWRRKAAVADQSQKPGLQAASQTSGTR
jgi:hypothetical protein